MLEKIKVFLEKMYVASVEIYNIQERYLFKDKYYIVKYTVLDHTDYYLPVKTSYILASDLEREV